MNTNERISEEFMKFQEFIETLDLLEDYLSSFAQHNNING